MNFDPEEEITEILRREFTGEYTERLHIDGCVSPALQLGLHRCKMR